MRVSRVLLFAGQDEAEAILRPCRVRKGISHLFLATALGVLASLEFGDEFRQKSLLGKLKAELWRPGNERD
jgi:hypothetical protein